jgi:hypothetical protein
MTLDRGGDSGEGNNMFSGQCGILGVNCGEDLGPNLTRGLCLRPVHLCAFDWAIYEYIGAG